MSWMGFHITILDLHVYIYFNAIYTTNEKLFAVFVLYISRAVLLSMMLSIYQKNYQDV